jgi:AraC-like DNA-binding protein
MHDILHVETISEMTKALGLEEPKHPLIYVVDASKLQAPQELKQNRFTFGYYSVFMKDGSCGMQYGRNRYDFDEGVLSFIAPNQVVSFNGEENNVVAGWGLYFHPCLIRKSSLGKSIDNYSFFSYDVHEALHLSRKEEEIMNDCIRKIEFELEQNIDAHSQKLLISNLELLLNYCNRFYERQFHTRADHHKDVFTKVDELIKDYYEQSMQLQLGTPTIPYLASLVNLSPNYLSDLLKKETGTNAKEHINDFVINRAKNTLLNSDATVSEIAYDLGFNYPHYFSRMFKQKTGQTPQEYRDLNLN